MSDLISIAGPEAVIALVCFVPVALFFFGAWGIAERFGPRGVSPQQKRTNNLNAWLLGIALALIVYLAVQHQVELGQSQGQTNITPNQIIQNIQESR